jgi:hypothetical protein
MCSGKFKTQGNLNNHMKIHSKEVNRKCSLSLGGQENGCFTKEKRKDSQRRKRQIYNNKIDLDSLRDSLQNVKNFLTSARTTKQHTLLTTPLILIPIRCELKNFWKKKKSTSLDLTFFLKSTMIIPLRKCTSISKNLCTRKASLSIK